jgi:hypothetical protein
MLKYIFAIFVYGLFASVGLASLQALDKDEAVLVRDLNSQGFKLNDSNLIILNGIANKNKLPQKSLYRVTFLCEHKEKIEECKIDGLAIKPKK